MGPVRARVAIAVLAALLLGPGVAVPAAAAAAARSDVIVLPGAQSDSPTSLLAHDLFKELIEIDTTDSVGNVTTASEAMAKHLLQAGFAPQDVQVLGPNERKRNLVVRFHGAGRHRPILLIGHLDIVAARREDWSTDPFQLVEKDGYFYGRGSIDMKSGDAIMMTTLLRMKKEHFRPSRDVILALTADEEGGSANGVDWLLRQHRDLIDAQFVINHDAESVVSEHDKPLFFEMDATEKVYADYQLMVTNPGGHSSKPVPDNAIYALSAGLLRIAKYPFPFELNAVSRGYYERMATIETGQRAADMRAILQPTPPVEAIERLSGDPLDNAMLRTTCVATGLAGGHANNALPQRAQAVVNCRILPGHSPEEVRHTLIAVLADSRIAVRYLADDGTPQDTAPEVKGFAPPGLDPQVMGPLEKLVAATWPHLKVVPTMQAGASDAVFTMAAGLPTYAIAPIAINREDERMHGRDERTGVQSFYTANEFFYRYIKALASD